MNTGDYADVINPNTINPNGLATYRWFGDANGNGIADPGEYDPSPLSTVQPKLNRIDPKLRDPKTDEITFGYQRELSHNLGLSASWIQRWFNDQTVDTEIGIPVTGETPRTLTEPLPASLRNAGDDRPLTSSRGQLQVRGQSVTLRTGCA